MSEHSHKYLVDAANAADIARSQIPFAKRTREFVISCFALYGTQENILELQNESKAMAFWDLIEQQLNIAKAFP
jgi:hypothetical protein